MVGLTGEQRALLRNWLTNFMNSFSNGVERQLSSELPFYTAPPEIVLFKTQVSGLGNELSKQPVDGPVEVADEVLPVIKAVVLHQRRELASQLDEPRGRTSHPSLLQSFDDRLRPFEVLMEQPWFHETAALQTPRLSDFLALERVEKIFQNFNALSARQFDEKFHILQAPGLFRADLRYVRQMCGARGRCAAAAYLDIDHFKSLNSKYGESVVDADVLPVFMRELEAAMFFRGFAYRYGGDEYVVLLPNVENNMAVVVMDDLRLRLGGLTYRNIVEKTTVSIGICIVEPDCFLTEGEVEQRANRAKNYAKEQGRNCIGTYGGSLFREEDLRVARAQSREKQPHREA
jgi:diguanylate cyclase (GGDEF)-like protein